MFAHSRHTNVHALHAIQYSFSAAAADEMDKRRALAQSGEHIIIIIIMLPIKP
jgi:hypothetical protein